jgi:hypothetical protein
MLSRLSIVNIVIDVCTIQCIGQNWYLTVKEKEVCCRGFQ